MPAIRHPLKRLQTWISETKGEGSFTMPFYLYLEVKRATKRLFEQTGIVKRDFVSVNTGGLSMRYNFLLIV